MKLKPHQRRVVAEQRDLQERIRALTVFVSGPHFAGEPPAEQRRQRRQLGLMERLDAVLLERIEAFN